MKHNTSKQQSINFAVVIPMANESADFNIFINTIKKNLDKLQSGKVYMVIDKASKDNTLALSESLSREDGRFITVWAPENRNVVDAYIRGYKEALKYGHEFIIEMDAGLSHDPRALPMFLRSLNEGNECVFGSRFVIGGSIQDSSWKRTLLSKLGTLLSNLLLGTKMYDMTSGFQGYRARIVKQFVKHEFLSKAHFYQTELRYILRKTRWVEVPIHYRAPSPSVSKKAIYNSIYVLLYYFLGRLTFRAISIR